jgi:hypothetical protein
VSVVAGLNRPPNKPLELTPLRADLARRDFGIQIHSNNIPI